MIKVEHLTKSFGATRAVDDLSFEIKKGEIVGLLGPNGAGKTTTMRLITGFYSPDEGIVEIAGKPISKTTAETQRYIGYMPENNPLYKEMLVSDLLEMSADLKSIPKEKRKASFDFAVKAVGIEDVFYRPIKELSKGYKQRVGMATALLHKPQILILDEPTEGLDPNQRTEIRSLIKDLAKDHTIIMSTHVMQEAQAICDRLIIINKGKLIADGTTEQLSLATRKEKIIILEVEGKDIENKIKKLSDIDKIEIKDSKKGRKEVRITIERKKEPEPEISKLSKENDWVIWSLKEEDHKLEDIFHKLTNELK